MTETLNEKARQFEGTPNEFIYDAESSPLPAGDYAGLVERLSEHNILNGPDWSGEDGQELQNDWCDKADELIKEAAIALATLVAERDASAVQWRKYGDEMHQRAMAAEAQVKAMDEALGPVENKSERYADKERNKIINLASGELENVINGHDPDMSILGNDVWDHLDRLCCDIEAHVARRARAVKGGANG